MPEQNTAVLPAEKVCTKCGEARPMDRFSRHSSGKFGRNPQCKDCQREQARAWRRANPEKWSAIQTSWQKRNPDKTKATRKRVNAARKAAGVPANTLQWWAERLIVLELDDGVCGICGLDVDPFNYSIDHIVPLARGGLHTLENLQVAHPRCNNRKHLEVPD